MNTSESPESCTLEGCTIRPAQAKDGPELVLMAQALAQQEGHESQFSVEAFHQCLPVRHSEEARSVAEESTQITKIDPSLTLRMTPLFFIATLNEQPVGFAMCYPGYDLVSASRGMHLGDIYVKPEHRSQGVGRALMAEVAKECFARDGDWVSLTVQQKNMRAQRFYFKHGGQMVPVQFMAFGATALADF